MGEQIMYLDIINKLEKILDESSSWDKIKDESTQFIADTRSEGNFHEDLKEDTEESTITDKAEKDIDNKETEEDQQVKTPDESPSTINLSDAEDFNNLVRVLNQFRASRSLTDSEVNQELKKYFDKLTTQEKYVLHVFIKGLVQITLLDVNGKAAYSPKDLKFNISKKGSAESEVIKSQSRLEKLKSMQDMPKDKASKEMKTPVDVIKVGESIQEKSSILEIVRKNNE